MFKVTTFRGWATDDQGDRIGANTSLGLVSATNLFTNVLEGDRVAVQQGAGRSWGESPWVMVGLLEESPWGMVGLLEEGAAYAETLATALRASHRAADATRCAYGYDFGALVLIINAIEGENKSRSLGLVSDVAALLRRDSQRVL
jgi:hypothetical protein